MFWGLLRDSQASLCLLKYPVPCDFRPLPPTWTEMAQKAAFTQHPSWTKPGYGHSSTILFHPYTNLDCARTAQGHTASKRLTGGTKIWPTSHLYLGKGRWGRGWASPKHPSRWPALTHLLKDLGSHGVAAVEDNAEFPATLHLLEQGARVVRVEGQLADLQADVVPRWGHDELLQSDEP